MRIAAIDPGPTKSALVVCEMLGAQQLPTLHEWVVLDNEALLTRLGCEHSWHRVLIERVAPYGQTIGWETIETIEWLSKFAFQAELHIHHVNPIARTQVKLALFGTTQRITDSAIRDEIIHRYGGKAQAVGKKKTPGPLYGLKADLWQAFALIIAWPDLKQDERKD